MYQHCKDVLGADLEKTIYAAFAKARKSLGRVTKTPLYNDGIYSYIILY